MGPNEVILQVAAALDRQPVVLWTALVGAGLVGYLLALLWWGRLPTLADLWPYLAVGGLVGFAYLRRARLTSRVRRRYDRLGRLVGRTPDEDWGDESAHGWGTRDARWSTDADGNVSDAETSDDGDWGWIQAFTFGSMLFSGSHLSVLDTPWFVGVVVGIGAVVVGARLLAACSPVRDGMAPARRGVPVCPSDRENRRS